jgi:hypothetical protein
MHRLLLPLLLAACDRPTAGDPGDPPAGEVAELPPTPMHRITRDEFRHAIASLTGFTLDDALLPPPEPIATFSNRSEGQTTGAEHVQAWLVAAETAVQRGLKLIPARARVELEDQGFAVGQASTSPVGAGTPWWVVQEPATLQVPVELPFRGAWTVQLIVAPLEFWPDPDRPRPTERAEVRITDTVTGASASTVLFEGSLGEPMTLSLTLDAAASGPRVIGITATPAADVQIAMDALVVEAPAATPQDRQTSARRALWTCALTGADARPCATTALVAMARRAWHRQVSEAEIAPYLALFDAELDALLAAGVEERDLPVGEALGEGPLLVALSALLVSPEFLFRIEGAVDRATPVAPHELAARLAAFLWADLPDEPLLTCVEAGRFTDDDTDGCSPADQATRMLADPRAGALATDFGAEWLRVHDLAQVTRDPALYPAAGPELYASMREETRRVLDELLRSDLPLTDLIDTDFSWWDERLAALYGRSDLGLVGFQRVVLGASGPRGVLRHASVLTATSAPGRTSPVRRGVLVRAQLLCDPPDPPPPGAAAGADALAEGPDALAAHELPGCASCHAGIDPFGFALEGFDAIGQPRTSYAGGAPIPTDTTLPDGTAAPDAAALIGWLNDPARFAACAREQLYTWAVARDLGDADRAALAAMPAEVNASVADVVQQIVASPAFRSRGGAP